MSLVVESGLLQAFPYISSKTQNVDESLKGLFESSLGVLLGRRQSKKRQKPLLDKFQTELFTMMCQASDEGIKHFMDSKAQQLNRFLITLFIASLQKAHPARASGEVERTEQRPETTEPVKPKEEKESSPHDEDEDSELPELYVYSTDESAEHETADEDEYDIDEQDQKYEKTEQLMMNEWKELLQVKQQQHQQHQQQQQQSQQQSQSLSSTIANNIGPISPSLPSSQVDTPNVDINKQFRYTPLSMSSSTTSYL
ncbi:hypothetical protein RFI_32627 [Reticulomyxa filosa]|uniref:Uncharacterized protein n=1 Tax=Reticulomyxa filosa TaxID=46433 RepID=X6LSZ6_RETFI|nr:hypothetical protein RFI_32627 [Reticulomyxa filosa]|eukprot:ETO04769.1 hypothetical protein RFI_32627 [Reticulomyxa filosa]